MLIELQKNGKHFVLKIKKDIMMNNAKAFYLEFEEIFRQKPIIDTLSFDFSSVQFMDSSGIGSLIMAASSAKKKCEEVIVFGLNNALSSVFKLSGLHSLIAIYSKENFFERFPEISNNE